MSPSTSPRLASTLEVNSAVAATPIAGSCCNAHSARERLYMRNSALSAHACLADGDTVKSVVVDNHQVKANFWDLAGAAEYFEVRNEFYRDAQGAILGTVPIATPHNAPPSRARPRRQCSVPINQHLNRAAGCPNVLPGHLVAGGKAHTIDAC